MNSDRLLADAQGTGTGDAPLSLKWLDLLGDCGLREQQLLCGPAEVQMLCDRPEYSNAEIFYHDAIRLLFPFKFQPGLSLLNDHNLYVQTYLSSCWIRAGNGVQGLTRDCTSNQRGEQIAWQNDRQKMPLPGKFYCHQSCH